jgi:hypothetical protein
LKYEGEIGLTMVDLKGAGKCCERGFSPKGLSGAAYDVAVGFNKKVEAS